MSYGLAKALSRRYGDTAWAVSHQHTGRTDLPLNERGSSMPGSWVGGGAGVSRGDRRTCVVVGSGYRAELRPHPSWDEPSTTVVSLSKGGNDRIAAQIAKRRPDILNRMKAREFTSVRQAAIAAGIGHVKAAQQEGPALGEGAGPLEAAAMGKRRGGLGCGRKADLPARRSATRRCAVATFLPASRAAGECRDLPYRTRHRPGRRIARNLCDCYSLPPKQTLSHREVWTARSVFPPP
jgi:hypothetical protein